MRMTFGILALVAAAGSASAADTLVTATLLNSAPVDSATQGLAVVDPAARYSNVTNFTGFALSNGGSAVQAGNTITRLNADDIHMTSAITNLTKFTFSFTNLNAVAVSARPRVRFYAADGAGGSAGTVIAGFSFSPITVNANSVNLFFTTNLGIALPQDFWAGMTFDNNTGATGATQAQMDNLGQGLFDAPDVGSSQDLFYQTTGAGSFFNNNPGPGSFFNLGHNPNANFGWEFVPAPASMALLGLGGLVVGRRRR